MDFFSLVLKSIGRINNLTLRPKDVQTRARPNLAHTNIYMFPCAKLGRARVWTSMGRNVRLFIRPQVNTNWIKISIHKYKSVFMDKLTLTSTY